MDGRVKHLKVSRNSMPAETCRVDYVSIRRLLFKVPIEKPFGNISKRKDTNHCYRRKVGKAVGTEMGIIQSVSVRNDK